MISVCIPVYNYNVVELVQDLSRQLDVLQAGGEILVFEDGSNPACQLPNNVLTAIPHVYYRVGPQNTGRIGVRNLLAEASNFPWLLFIDGDSKMINEGFLHNYCSAVKENGDV